MNKDKHFNLEDLLPKHDKTSNLNYKSQMMTQEVFGKIATKDEMLDYLTENTPTPRNNYEQYDENELARFCYRVHRKHNR